MSPGSPEALRSGEDSEHPGENRSEESRAQKSRKCSGVMDELVKEMRVPKGLPNSQTHGSGSPPTWTHSALPRDFTPEFTDTWNALLSMSAGFQKAETF